MMTLFYTWVIVGCLIVITEIVNAIVYPEYRSKWWIFNVLGTAIIWPFLLLLMVVFGIYNTIKLRLW